MLWSMPGFSAPTSSSKDTALAVWSPRARSDVARGADYLRPGDGSRSTSDILIRDTSFLAVVWSITVNTPRWHETAGEETVDGVLGCHRRACT